MQNAFANLSCHAKMMLIFADLSVAIAAVAPRLTAQQAKRLIGHAMKINRSVIIAIIALAFIGIWFWVNSSGGESEAAQPSSTSNEQIELPTVVVEPRIAVDYDSAFELYGKSEPNREVTIKAETAGLVASTPIKEGRFVRKGTVVCRQDIDARKANLDQAQAMLTTRELEYKAAKTLVEKGYRSETQAATALAALDGAKAMVTQAKIELDNVNMRAPFAGVFDRQIAEVGDFLGPGQPCGLLLELNPLIVASDLTEAQVGRVKTGQEASVKLATGETLTGIVSLVESRANPSTRTFRTEVQVPNPDLNLKAGLTATVRLKAGTTKAQHVPSRILSLSDTGEVGVRYLDNRNIVRFAATETIDEDETGIWVTGLPDETRIIVQGQDFVSIGVETNPSQSLLNSAATQ